MDGVTIDSIIEGADAPYKPSAVGSAAGNAAGSLIDFGAHLLASVRYRAYFVLFIVFIFITSDVFVNIVLKKMSGAESGGAATPYGVILQGLGIVLAMMVIDGLDAADCL